MGKSWKKLKKNNFSKKRFSKIFHNRDFRFSQLKLSFSKCQFQLRKSKIPDYFFSEKTFFEKYFFRNYFENEKRNIFYSSLFYRFQSGKLLLENMFLIFLTNIFLCKRTFLKRCNLPDTIWFHLWLHGPLSRTMGSDKFRQFSA